MPALQPAFVTADSAPPMVQRPSDSTATDLLAMIVDDYPARAQATQAQLHEAWPEVTLIVANRARAAALIPRVYPDLVLAEWNYADGEKGTDLLRNWPDQKNVPLVLVQRSQEPIPAESLVGGPYAVLRAPFDREAARLALRQIARYTQRSRGHQNLTRLLENTLPSLSDGLVGIDPQGRISAANARAIELLDRRDQPLHGMRVMDVVRFCDAESGEEIDDCLSQTLENGAQSEYFDLNLICLPTGRQSHADISFTPLHAADETLIGALMVLRTPETSAGTKRVSLSDARQAALIDLGLAASGAAHDINNLLGVILAQADWLAGKPRDWAANRKTADAIKVATRRAGEICGQLLGDENPNAKDLQPTALADFLSETVRLHAHRLERNCQVHLDVEPAIPMVPLNRVRFGQLVSNLLINAVDACDATGMAGTIIVTARRVRALPDKLVIAPPARQKCTWVRCEVRDSGPGMDPTTLVRVLSPFYTTKRNGRGLGLAIVQRVVQEHYGALAVNSDPGRGTSFSVYLPIEFVRSGSSNESEITELEGQPCRGRVLLAEDDETIREVVALILQPAGYTVESFADGKTLAARLTDPIAPRPDALILDVNLPGVSGPEIYRRARGATPELPTVFISGAPMHLLQAEIGPDPSVRFIAKPFDLNAISHALEALLTG